MSVLLRYAVLALAPALLLIAVEQAVARWCRGGRDPRSPEPAGRSLEQLAADLRRLDTEQRTLTDAAVTTQGLRLRAVSLAYDDTLRACCRVVGVDEPTTPLTAIDRLQTEALLAQHGVTW